MAKVAFKNIADQDFEFVENDKQVLVLSCYEYAKNQEYKLYDLIINHKVSIFLNNELIHPDNWAETEVEKEDEIIITPIIAGGQGGFLKIILGAVLIVVAIIAPYIGIPATVTLFGAEVSVGLMIAGLGVSMMLSGISQLLFQPDLPSLPSLSAGNYGGNYGGGNQGLASGSKQTQTYNWSGIKTTAKYDTPIPAVYGTHMVGGNIISCFTDSENGTDNYLYMLLALCEGEIEGICKESDNTDTCTTSDQSDDTNYEHPAILVNNQPLRHFDNVTWWYRTGTNESNAGYDEFYPYVQNKIPYFDGAKVQYDDGRELTTEGIEYTTTKEVDMISLSLLAPSLYKQSNGAIVSNTVYYNIQYKPTSGGTWYSFHGSGTVNYWTVSKRATKGNVNNITAVFKDSDRLYYKPDTYKIKINSNNFSSMYNTRDESYYYNGILIEGKYEDAINYTMNVTITDEETGTSTTSDIQQAVSRQIKVWYTYEWIAETYWDEFMGVEASRWVPSAIRNVEIRNEQHHYGTSEIGDYKLTIKHNVSAGDIFYMEGTKGSVVSYGEWIPIQGKATTGIRSSVDLDFNNLTGATGKGIYDIKVRRRYNPSSSTDVGDVLRLQSVTEIIQGDFIYPNTALLGIKIKATGQLSGGIPSITTILKGTKVDVPSFDESTSFNDSYYDNVQERFEDSLGNPLTWDESTYTKEYSNNSMLCVRDMMLNPLYGLGSYIKNDDLYDAGIVSAIKSCHVEYNPYAGNEPDYLSWWDGGFNHQWAINWGFIMGSGSSSSTDRYIDCSSYYNYLIKLNLTTGLYVGADYTISVEIANSTKNIDMTLLGSKENDGEKIELDTLSNKGDGIHTSTFTNIINDINYLYININTTDSYNDSNYGKPVDFRINDISLTGNIRDHYHTWDGVLESGQSALAAMFEMCDSFRCWPVWYNGRFNFVVDQDETPVHTITMGNMLENSFKQSFTGLSEIPYRLIGQYVDKSKRYDLQSLIAMSTSTQLTKSNERIIGLKGITNRQKAERELIWKLNKTTNCTHMVSFKCGLDYIHATAGDIINVQQTLPSWGNGGRIVDYNASAKQITLDQEITLDNVSTYNYIIQYQTPDNDFITATVAATTLGNGDHQQITIKNWGSSYCATDSVYAVGKENTYIKEFRITSVKRDSDNTVEVEGIEHLSSLYTDEPTIKVVEDRSTQLPEFEVKPPKPSVSVRPLPYVEGVGFIFDIQSSSYSVTETVIQMSNEEDGTYSTILNIPENENFAKYIDNNLPLDKTYYFKIFSRNIGLKSDSVYINCYLSKELYTLPYPTGLKIKNTNTGSSTFEGKDVTISWNTPNNTYEGSNSLIRGYNVEVFGSQYSKYPLRSVTVANTEYTYTFENNIEDTSGTPNASIFFILRTQVQNGVLSNPSPFFKVENSIPADISNLTAEPIVGGVKFKWDKSEEKDHKNYQYRTKVSTATWTNWTNTTDNTLVYSLTASEIGDYTDSAKIYIKVKDKDWYEQTSSTEASVNATANTTSDNIFKLSAVKSGGIGDVEDLYDGDKTSGGVTF